MAKHKRGAKPRVYIRKQALFCMLAEAIIHFKKECFGTVFGTRPTRKGNAYVVEDAIPRSDAELSFTELLFSGKTDERLSNLFDAYPLLYPYLGMFHSHTERGAVRYEAIPSDDDIDGMKRHAELYGVHLEFIVGIYTHREGGRKKWRTLSSGSIKGTLGNYDFHISVFVISENPRKKLEQLDIVASPAIAALNKADR